jgi:holliday junction DNA helicase RuvA
MIGKLKGLIDSFGEDYVILDVNGVGYVVSCSSRTLAHLPRPGEPATLSIETQVREDAIRLFGFLDEAERDWFRLLQSVQGVGAKVALALLSTLAADALAQAVAGQDKAMVARAPGVGPKLAARIVAELKDKAPAGAVAIALAAAPADGPAVPSAARDAVSALCNLGYGRPQAQAAVNASLAALGPEADASALIRRGLKELAQ